MASLTGQTIASTYHRLLTIDSDNFAADASAKYIKDGDAGTSSILSLSTTRVGIGTASPSKMFHVYDADAGTDPLAIFHNAGSNEDASISVINDAQTITLGIDGSDSDKFKISDNTALGTNDRLTMDTSGNITLSADLYVGDDLFLSSDSAVFNMGAGNDITLTHDGSTGGTLASAGAFVVDSTATTLTLDGHTGVTVQSTNSGDITLDSVADIVLDAAGGNFEFKDAGTAQLTIDVDGTAGDIDINLMVNGDDLVFNQYDGTEVMRITDTARVGIGNDSPSYKLDVKIANGNDNTIVARFENADASDPNGIYINHSGIDLSSDDSADHSYINCADSNNTPFVVYGDGDVVNEDNSYTSDVRIKKDITDATSKLEDLLKLKVRNYKFKKSDGGDVAGKLGGKRIGFIADELEEVFPNLIVKRKTTKFGVEYDDLKSIRVSALMPIVIKAVQELSASNDALKARIEVLEG